MRSWKCRFRTCANERVWTRVKLQSHALKFKGNGPLDPLWALQCRKLGMDIFFWSSWGSNTSFLKMCVRGTHDQHSLTQLEEKGYWVLLLCELALLLTWVWVIVGHSHEFAWVSFFDQVGSMSVGHARLSDTLSSELVFEPQLDHKKISTPSFLHYRDQSGSKGPFPLSLSA